LQQRPENFVSIIIKLKSKGKLTFQAASLLSATEVASASDIGPGNVSNENYLKGKKYLKRETMVVVIFALNYL
jgi:hypothetical protein